MSPYIKGPADKPLLGGEVVRGVSRWTSGWRGRSADRHQGRVVQGGLL